MLTFEYDYLCSNAHSVYDRSVSDISGYGISMYHISGHDIFLKPYNML